MFDKLIESDTAGADFKNRSRYFTVSTIIVGILFLTAVVYSLYAAEVGLGNTNFDVSELVAPLETNEPEKPEPQQSLPNRGEQSVSRPNSDMARVDEPTIAPTGTSAQRNSRPARSWEGFDPHLPISNGSGGTPGDVSSIRRDGTGSYDPKDVEREDIDPKDAAPPPVVKPKSPSIVRISRLLNGDAISLPKPIYPRSAVMLNLEGMVKVQVTIDEKGNVVSAKAAEGHPLFRGISEQAARGAKFKPTLLNDAAVKVTGIITYNFKKP